MKCFSVKDALIVFRQDERCGSVGFGSETSMSLRGECQNGVCDACFHFDVDPCSNGRSPSWTPCVGELLHREEPASKLNDKRSPARLNGRSEWLLLHHRAGNVRGLHGVPW